MARSSTLAGRRFGALEALEEAATIETGSDLRNEAVACLALVDVGNGRALDTGVPSGDEAAGIDAEFGRYAWSDKHGRIVVRGVDAPADDPGILLRENGHRAMRLLFDPTGRLLGVGERGGWLEVRKLEAPYAVVARVERSAPRGNWSFSPDGERIAFSDRSGSLAILDFGEGEIVERFPDIKVAYAIEYDPAGDHLAVLGAASSESWFGAVVEANTGDVVVRWAELRSPAYTAWHPEGRLLAVGSEDALTLRDATNGEAIHTIAKRQITGIAFQPSARFFGATGWDGYLSLFDTRTGHLLGRVSGNRGAYFSRDGRRLAAGSLTPSLEVFDVADGAEFRELVCEDGNSDLKELVISPNGQLVASGGRKGVTIWEIESGRVATSLVAPDQVGSCAFSADGRAIVGVSTSSLCRWTRAADGSWLRSLVPRPTPAEGLPLAAFDPPRERAAVVESRLGGSILELGTGARIGAPLELFAIWRLSWSPDGRWIVGSQRHGDGTVRVWDGASGAPVRDLPAKDAASAFSPDGRVLVVGDQFGYVARSTESWEILWTLERCSLRSSPAFAFSPDGALLGAFDDVRVIRLLRAESGAELLRLATPAENVFGAVTIGPSSRTVAALGEDYLVAIWNLAHIRRRLREMGLDWEPPLDDPR